MPDEAPQFTPTRVMRNLATIGLPEVPLVGWYQPHRAGEDVGPHRHDGIEVRYLNKGQQFYRLADRDFVQRGGDVSFTLPGELHSSGGHPVERQQLIWFQVVPGDCRKVVLGMTPTAVRAVIDGLKTVPTRCFSAGPNLAFLFHRLHALLSEPSQGNIRLIAAVIMHILLELPLRAGTTRNEPSSSISAALTFIEENLGEDLSVPSVARAVGLSCSWFKQLFKAETGTPPGEYILGRKINRASKVIQETYLPITRIAYDLGFSSSQNFATAYRRYTGESPRETRRRHSEMEHGTVPASPRGRRGVDSLG